MRSSDIYLRCTKMFLINMFKGINCIRTDSRACYVEATLNSSTRLLFQRASG